MGPLEGGTDWQLTDRLFLWWLADPRVPRLVGDLQLVRALNRLLKYRPKSGRPAPSLRLDCQVSRYAECQA